MPEPATRPNTPDSTPRAPTHIELDAQAVKVLAHPLRSRLLSALRVNGPDTATGLASRLSTNTGATSYHLRRLAEVGLVADTGAGRGRERVWCAATEAHSWSNTAFGEDEDARTALGWLVRGYHRTFDEAYGHWLDVADSWPADWQDACGMDDRWVTITAAQTRQLRAELDAVLDRYRDAGAADPTARRIHVYSVAFPLDSDALPAGEPQ